MINFLLAVICILLYVFNFEICDYYCTDLKEWYALRYKLYAALFAISYYLETTKKGRSTYFLLKVLGGITFGDFIDRCFFDVTQRQWNDIVTIIFSLIYAIKK